jgi:hypothetical protein
LRPGSAAKNRSGQEQPLDTLPQQKSQYLVRLRRQRSVQALHRLGARVLFELLDEIARHHGLGEDIDQRLERYAGVDPDLLRAVGGDRFARLPIRIVGGSR